MPPKKSGNNKKKANKVPPRPTLSTYFKDDQLAAIEEKKLGKGEIKDDKPIASPTVSGYQVTNMINQEAQIERDITSMPYVFKGNKLVRNEVYVEPKTSNNVGPAGRIVLSENSVSVPLYIEALTKNIDEKHRYVGSTYTQPMEFTLTQEDWKMFRSVGWNYWRSGLYYDDDSGILPAFDDNAKSGCLRRLAAILFELEILTKSCRLDDSSFQKFMLRTMNLQSYKSKISVFFQEVREDTAIEEFFSQSKLYFLNGINESVVSLPSEFAYDYIKLYCEEVKRWIVALELYKPFERVSGFKWKGNYWDVLKELSDAKQALMLLAAERYAQFKERGISGPMLSQLAVEISKLALEDRETSLIKAAEDCSLKLEDFMTKQLSEKDSQIAELKNELDQIKEKWNKGLLNERRTTAQLDTDELSGVKIAQTMDLKTRMETKFNEAFSSALTSEEFGYLKAYLDRIHVMLKNMEVDYKITLSDLFLASSSEENNGKDLPSVDTLIGDKVLRNTLLTPDAPDLFYVGDVMLPMMSGQRVMDFTYFETTGKYCESIPAACNSDVAMAYQYRTLSNPYNREDYRPEVQLFVPPQLQREYTAVGKLETLKERDDYHVSKLDKELNNSWTEHTLRRRRNLYDEMKRCTFKVGESVPLYVHEYAHNGYKGEIFISPRYMETNWQTRPYQLNQNLLSIIVYDEKLQEIKPCDHCWKYGFVSIQGPTNIMTSENWKEFTLTVNCSSKNHVAKEYHVIVTTHTISLPISIHHFCFLKFADPRPRTLVALYKYGAQIDDFRYTPMDLITRENIWFDALQTDQLFSM